MDDRPRRVSGGTELGLQVASLASVLECHNKGRLHSKESALARYCGWRRVATGGTDVGSAWERGQGRELGRGGRAGGRLGSVLVGAEDAGCGAGVADGSG